MVQLEHLPQHGALEHARESLRVQRRDLDVERVEPAAAHGGVGMQQPHRDPLHDERRHHIAVPAEHVDQPTSPARARRPRLHDLGPLPARDLVLDQRVLEPDRLAAKLLESRRRAVRIRGAPDRSHDADCPREPRRPSPGRTPSSSRAPRRRGRGFPGASRSRRVAGPRPPPARAHPSAARSRPRRSRARARAARPARAGRSPRQLRPGTGRPASRAKLRRNGNAAERGRSSNAYRAAASCPTQLIPNGRPARSIASQASPACSRGTSASARRSDWSSHEVGMPATRPCANGATARGSPDSPNAPSARSTSGGAAAEQPDRRQLRWTRRARSSAAKRRASTCRRSRRRAAGVRIREHDHAARSVAAPPGACRRTARRPGRRRRRHEPRGERGQLRRRRLEHELARARSGRPGRRPGRTRRARPPPSRSSSPPACRRASQSTAPARCRTTSSEVGRSTRIRWSPTRCRRYSRPVRLPCS